MQKQESVQVGMKIASRLGIYGLIFLAAATLVYTALLLRLYVVYAFDVPSLFMFTSVVSAQAEPELPVSELTQFSFQQVLVETTGLSAGPRFMYAFAMAYPFVIAVFGSFGFIMMCIGALRSKPFGRLSQVALAFGGFLAIVGSVLAPWCEKQAVVMAIEELGLPTSPTRNPLMRDYLIPPDFNWLWHLNWSWLILGVVLVWIAFYWQKAAKFQRDQEGLV